MWCHRISNSIDYSEISDLVGCLKHYEVEGMVMLDEIVCIDSKVCLQILNALVILLIVRT